MTVSFLTLDKIMRDFYTEEIKLKIRRDILQGIYDMNTNLRVSFQ